MILVLLLVCWLLALAARFPILTPSVVFPAFFCWLLALPLFLLTICFPAFLLSSSTSGYVRFPDLPLVFTSFLFANTLLLHHAPPSALLILPLNCTSPFGIASLARSPWSPWVGGYCSISIHVIHYICAVHCVLREGSFGASTLAVCRAR